MGIAVDKNFTVGFTVTGFLQKKQIGNMKGP